MSSALDVESSVLSHCKLRTRGQHAGYTMLQKGKKKMLRMSGDARLLMVIHFPTGDSARGGFAKNFQVLSFSFFLSSISFEVLFGTCF